MKHKIFHIEDPIMIYERGPVRSYSKSKRRIIGPYKIKKKKQQCLCSQASIKNTHFSYLLMSTICSPIARQTPPWRLKKKTAQLNRLTTLTLPHCTYVMHMRTTTDEEDTALEESEHEDAFFFFGRRQSHTWFLWNLGLSYFSQLSYLGVSLFSRIVPHWIGSFLQHMYLVLLLFI